MEGPFTEASVRRARLIGAVLAVVQFSVVAHPPRAAHLIELLLVGAPLALLGVNLLSHLAAGRRWSPALQITLDTVICLLIVAGMGAQPSSAWVLLALPLAEAALRSSLSGAVLAWFCMVPLYTLAWRWAWTTFGVDALDLRSLLLRAGTLLLIGMLGGSMAQQLRRQSTALRDALAESEHRAEMMRVVAATGRRLPVDDLPSLLDRVAAAALRLGFEAAELALIDPALDERVVAAQRGLPPSATEGPLPADLGLVGAVTQAARTLIIADYSSWAGADPAVLDVGLCQAIGTPVWVSGRVEGVLCAGWRYERQATPGEIECLEMLAVEAGAGLEAARRLEDQASYASLLQRQARQDPLTGLVNRAYLLELLRSRARDGSAPPAAILFADLDRFKHVNDTFGHGGGDQLLRMVAARMGNAIRPPDVLARLGGDEFVVLLHQADELSAVKVADRLHHALEESFTLYTRPVQISASIGIALVDDEVSPDLVLAQADMAMYRAKELRRPRTAVHDEDLQHTMLRRVRLETDLHGVELRGELSVVYQPLFRADRRAVVGAEALLRWSHPHLGQVMPGEFVPLAELNDCLRAMGWWVIERACRQLLRWRERDPAFRVWVNVSPSQLTEAGFAARLEALLERLGCPGAGLVLELTEAPLRSGELEAAQATMRHLHGLGVSLVADDFGQESSSLGRLRQLPFDGIKIDRALLADLGDSADQFAVVRSITELAHDLRLEVVAEGVEREDQLAALQLAGCDLLQGFQLGRPMPPDDISLLVGAPH
jgi:diguanylate cyclase (GGDEF)-like protein